MRYTKGESTTVSVDIAQDIMASLMYTVDAYLINLHNHELALEVLRSADVQEIHRRGLDVISACLEEARALYLKVRKHKLHVGLEAYDLTINESLPTFFSKYGVMFSAHNSMTAIDYPLLFDDWSVQGVFYMRNYLRNLEIESEFCLHFAEDEIKKLLTALGETYNIDYRVTLTNIFEQVVNAAVFAVLAKHDALALTLSRSEYDALQSYLKQQSASNIELTVRKALKDVVDQLSITREDLLAYIERYTPMLVKKIIAAVHNDTIDKLVPVTNEQPVVSHEFTLANTARLNNPQFRELVKEISACTSAQQKITLIRARVLSLDDFLDILQSNCLWGDEYINLYRTLGTTELILLAKAAFADEFREQSSITEIISNIQPTGVEWQDYLTQHLRERLSQMH